MFFIFGKLSVIISSGIFLFSSPLPSSWDSHNAYVDTFNVSHRSTSLSTFLHSFFFTVLRLDNFSFVKFSDPFSCLLKYADLLQ